MFIKKILLALGLFSFSVASYAADANKCKIYGGKDCPEKPAASAEYKPDVDARGWAVEPADAGQTSSGFEGTGKQVEVELRVPAADYVQGENRKKILRASDTNIGVVDINDTSVSTEPGAAQGSANGYDGGQNQTAEPEPFVDNSCNYQQLVGKKLSEVTMPPKSRVLREGQPVTEEYMIGRVNVIVNKLNVIVRVTCG